MAATIRPVRVNRGDVDAARDFRIDFFKARFRAISKPFSARSKNCWEQP